MNKLFVVLFILLASCQAHVAPYEREYLAKPSMDPVDERHEEKFTTHIHDSREGATGGNTSVGGGCGCN